MKQATRGVTRVPEIRPKKKQRYAAKCHIYVCVHNGVWFWEMRRGPDGDLLCISRSYPNVGAANRAAAIMQDSLSEEKRGPIHYPEDHNYSGGN